MTRYALCSIPSAFFYKILFSFFILFFLLSSLPSHINTSFRTVSWLRDLKVRFFFAISFFFFFLLFINNLFFLLPSLPSHTNTSFRMVSWLRDLKVRFFFAISFFFCFI